jgi:hypothetical protein
VVVARYIVQLVYATHTLVSEHLKRERRGGEARRRKEDEGEERGRSERRKELLSRRKMRQ